MLITLKNSSTMVTSNMNVTNVLNLSDIASQVNISKVSSNKVFSNSGKVSRQVKGLPLKDFALKSNVWRNHRGQRKGRVIRIARSPKP